MIADYQVHLHQGKIKPPFAKPGVLQICAAVKKIADKNNFFRLEILNLLPEAMQVFFINLGRNCNSSATKMPRLSKMEIGDDQAFLCLPKQTALRSKPKLLIP